jgi:hypothetical protein
MTSRPTSIFYVYLHYSQFGEQLSIVLSVKTFVTGNKTLNLCYQESDKGPCKTGTFASVG